VACTMPGHFGHPATQVLFTRYNISLPWHSKFESSNECNQAEGCVDPDVIAQNFSSHFNKSYTANKVKVGVFCNVR